MGRGVGGDVQEGGDICIHIADSGCCTAETNTTLQSNYTPIMIRTKIKKNSNRKKEKQQDQKKV